MAEKPEITVSQVGLALESAYDYHGKCINSAQFHYPETLPQGIGSEVKCYQLGVIMGLRMAKDIVEKL